MRSTPRALRAPLAAVAAVTLEWSPLRGIFFATGLLQTVLAALALGTCPRPLPAREIAAR